MKNRIAALTVVLSLMISMLLGAVPVSAASGDFTIGTQISSQPDQREFVVTNHTSQSIDIQYYTTVDSTIRTKTVSANGSVTLACSDPNMSGMTLYVNANGTTLSKVSLDSYWINVYYQSEDGVSLGGTRIECSKSAGGVYTAPESLTVGSQRYLITGEDYRSVSYATKTQLLTFTYRREAKPDYACKILYLDEYGNQLRSDSMKVTEDQPGNFTADDTITAANGREYKLASGQSKTINHPYDLGEKTYTFTYSLVKEEASHNPYLIRIVYQDAATGRQLASRTATVQYGKETVVNVPSEFVTTGGIQYRRASGEPSQISHEYSDSQRTYVIGFEEEKGGNAPYTIQVRYINAMNGAVFKTRSANVGIDETARVSVDASFEDGGKTYLLASGQPETITHQFGTSKRVYDVYYNERGADAVDEYEVTIRYFDITDSELLYTTTETATFGSTLQVTAPESYTAGGEEYVLLSGQDTSVAHDFYSTRHVYVFFYRNADDTANADTVVVPDAAGDAVVTTPDNNVITATPGGGITVTTPDGETVTIVEPEIPEADQPVEEEPEETTTIEDEETPLAETPEQEENGGSGLAVGLTVGGIVLVLAAAGVVFFLVWKKRRGANR